MPLPAQHSQLCANVARLLRQEREKRGISLNSMAQQAGISRQTVSFIEAQERNPTLMTLLRITHVLEIPLEELIANARAAQATRKR